MLQKRMFNLRNISMNSNPEYIFSCKYEQLQHLPCHRLDMLQEIEQELYSVLAQNPDNIAGLIVLLKNQQMQGRGEKSRTLAHKIWSIGGDISLYQEYCYIDLLLSLGMLDMALTLLQPRFSNLTDNIDMFAPVMIRFALQTGNIPLLSQVVSASNGGYKQLFDEFINAYQELEYAEHFKNVQRLIADILREHRLGFSYKLYYDRGFTDLSVIYYTDIPIESCDNMTQDINRKIDAYHTSSGIKRLYNYEVKIKNIAECPADF